jgi:hypothetical protein
MESSRRKKVLCPMEKNGKTFWLRIGSAFINGDGSTNVYLDAYPANCKLQIRDLDDRDLQSKSNREEGRSNGVGEQEAEQIPF